MKTLVLAFILAFGFLSNSALSAQNINHVSACNLSGWVTPLADTGGKLNTVMAAIQAHRIHPDSLNEYAGLISPIPSISLLKIKALDENNISVYPNPFTSTTSIAYSLPFKARVALSIHDRNGKEVAFLREGRKRPGLHSTTLIRGHLMNGEYDYKLILYSRGQKQLLSGTLMIQ